MINKRGQAAMEFLMTYGWAILAAIIAIGVIAYFGVFTPGKYVGSSAIVTAPFYANAWNVQSAGDTVTLEIRNNGGENLDVEKIVLSITDPAVITCTDSTAFTINSGALSARTITLNVATCGSALNLLQGNNFKAGITITYERTGSNVDLTSTGSITDTAA